MDCTGLFAVPGLIDGHVHIESTLLTPQNLAKIVLPRGTTSLLIDPMEIANVAGIEGVRTFLRGTERLPLKLFIQIPSRVPTAPGLETTGGVLGLDEIKEMLTWEASIALGELDPSKVDPPLDEYILKILLTEAMGKIAVGHAAGLNGRRLDAYAAAGLRDDHECVSAEEALDRLRLGLDIMVREGTSERNLDELIKLVTTMGVPSDRLFFCTDDKHINDIEREGHIDFNVRRAVAAGVPAIKAIQMATVNCARHFRIDHLVGCLAPGRSADIVLAESLSDFHATIVLANGEMVAKNDRLSVDLPDLDWPDWTLNTVHVGTVDPDKLMVPAKDSSVRVKVIEIVEGQITNRWLEEDVPVKNGQVLPVPGRDILKIVCVERHAASGNVGVSFVRGFNLHDGAMAASVSHDHHNIVAVGTNDADILCAVEAIKAMQGGFVATRGGRVLEKLELPLFGLISRLAPEELLVAMENLNRATWEMGCRLKAPFMTLSFVSLPTVPELGLTDLGLVDVSAHRLISLFA
jgi:adenine deaminase